MPRCLEEVMVLVKQMVLEREKACNWACRNFKKRVDSSAPHPEGH